MTLEEILNEYPEESFLKADGFDDAVIGLEHLNMKLVYDMDKMIKILENQGMSYEESVEYLEFNTWTAYMGEQTPLFINI